MSDLEKIREIKIKMAIIERTIDLLQDAGTKGVEGIALWVGMTNGSSFEVKDLIFPRQSGLITKDGLLVVVEADELYRINRWLFDHDMIAIAQLHTHAEEAYHSLTDDSFPIVTALGGFSIVVPEFASRRFHFSDCAVYRLGMNGWHSLDAELVNSLMKVVD